MLLLLIYHQLLLKLELFWDIFKKVSGKKTFFCWPYKDSTKCLLYVQPAKVAQPHPNSRISFTPYVTTLTNNPFKRDYSPVNLPLRVITVYCEKNRGNKPKEQVWLIFIYLFKQWLYNDELDFIKQKRDVINIFTGFSLLWLR